MDGQGMGKDLLLWMDMEMSGLDPERERILEVAALITDGNLEVVAHGPHVIVHQSEAVLGAMDEWNTTHHGASGLIDQVRSSTVGDADVERQLLDFVRAHGDQRKIPLAGNSIHQDRRFLERYMPKLEAFLHYRNVDVSSIKELVRRWYPDVYAKAPKKRDAHRAVDDLMESVEELRYYRQTVFR